MWMPLHFILKALRKFCDASTYNILSTLLALHFSLLQQHQLSISTSSNQNICSVDFCPSRLFSFSSKLLSITQENRRKVPISADYWFFSHKKISVLSQKDGQRDSIPWGEKLLRKASSKRPWKKIILFFLMFLQMWFEMNPKSFFNQFIAKKCHKICSPLAKWRKQKATELETVACFIADLREWPAI